MSEHYEVFMLPLKITAENMLQLL